MRRAARVDANHADIVSDFRRMGYSVANTSQLGGGFPDLVISRLNITALVEVKDGEKVPSKRKLTPAEFDFCQGWRGVYIVVESQADVLKAHQIMSDEARMRVRGMK